MYCLFLFQKLKHRKLRKATENTKSDTTKTRSRQPTFLTKSKSMTTPNYIPQHHKAIETPQKEKKTTRL